MSGQSAADQLKADLCLETKVVQRKVAAALPAIQQEAAAAERVGSLDEAWGEAEAAIADGEWLYLSRNNKGIYGAQVRGGKNVRTGAGGPTPTAALHALAARLREPTP